LHHSRDIGAAVGIIMAMHKVCREEAFDLLREASMRTNTKLYLLALEVQQTGVSPRERTPPYLSRTAYLSRAPVSTRGLHMGPSHGAFTWGLDAESTSARHARRVNQGFAEPASGGCPASTTAVQRGGHE
jgi:hypothetical protein